MHGKYQQLQFCKDFNGKTQHIKPDVPMRVYITAYEDKTYKYWIRPPTATYFIKQALGLETLASRPGHEIVGQISLKHLYEIAKVKRVEHPYNTLRSMVAQLAGNCRVMGVEVVRNIEEDVSEEVEQSQK
eukprot:TRINITY_DN10523_c0_g1_i2.p2 TRINITY_DN10523_c0_g1~~TRINITY_DN10523_c0_g1_i2.p2  ORF type:complete len:130 (-),score=10.44 TRINITY_DN10523_c0_g1_i2:492-881(-)